MDQIILIRYSIATKSHIVCMYLIMRFLFHFPSFTRYPFIKAQTVIVFHTIRHNDSLTEICLNTTSLRMRYGVASGSVTHLGRVTHIYTHNNKHVYRQGQVRKPNGSEVKWLNAHSSWGRAVEFLASSSLAQSVCEWAFSLLENRCLETYRFESCIQQRKTTCLLSIRISIACARASKFTTTNT